MTKSPYDRKVAEAQVIINDHNSHLGKDDSHLSWDDILAKLKKMGGTTEETLREMTWEDIQDAGVPRVLARRIANQVFRKNGNKAKKTKVRYQFTVNAVATMSFLELFENYDPSGETNPAIRDRLQIESQGKRCVIFDPANKAKVLAKLSAQALRYLKEGHGEQESILVKMDTVNVPTKLFAVGENPNEYAAENFMYPGEMLRDGVCNHTGRDLSNVPFEAQQIVYLAITNTGETNVGDVELAHRIMDMLDCDDPVGKVQARYHKAALVLQELKNTGGEPRLMLLRKSGLATYSPRPNNPFGPHLTT